MNRKYAIEMVKSYTYDELAAWENHVWFCLQMHKKDDNAREVDDCEFLLKEIQNQMTLLQNNEK